MKAELKTKFTEIVVDGSYIRVQLKDKSSSVGIVSLLPKIQLAVGEKFSNFAKALELSRVPLAYRITNKKEAFLTYEIVRLETGQIKEATIAKITVYEGIVIGVTYDQNVLSDMEFRKYVQLSAMHQLVIGKQGDKGLAFKATQVVSMLTKYPREKMMVVETVKSLKVKVEYNSSLNLPLYYTFALDKNNDYNLLQIAYSYNDAIIALKEKLDA